MSKKVYISPSDQVSNAYAWGNTNEHVQCQKIAEAEAAALRRSGVEVQVAALGSTMAQRCAQSDAFKADIHNCVHTNACNKQVMGTRLFCYAIPGKVYEVRVPDAPSVYCECEFHDTAEGAKWIVEHTTEIGEAIAKGLCKYLGVTFVPAKAEEKPAEEPKADTEQVLYRVQVGAFSVRANADRMLEKLKAAGFTGFVVKGKK